MTTNFTKADNDNLFDMDPQVDPQSAEYEQQRLWDDLNRMYETMGIWKAHTVNVQNILIVGRSRAGKTTLQKVLIDPRTMPKDLSLYSQTKRINIASLLVNNETQSQSGPPPNSSDNRNSVVLNMIDTPGLFEVSRNDGELARANRDLLGTIEKDVKRMGSLFHYICFCISVTDGFRTEDQITMDSILQYFGGDELAKNACVIITRCESKTKEQLEQLKREVQSKLPIVRKFQHGIFFSGAFKFEDWTQGNNEALRRQNKKVLVYRNMLLDLFTKPIKPLELTDNDTVYVKDDSVRKRASPNSTDPNPRVNPAMPSFGALVPTTLSIPRTTGTSLPYDRRIEPDCMNCPRELHCRIHCHKPCKIS